MDNLSLESYLNEFLNASDFKDYAPNGLQVEGKKEVQTIVTGVTACQALIDKAIMLKADAVIVHHGYFWKNEPEVITGMKRNRIKALLDHNINLYAYHLPLDAHPEIGNNAGLAKALGITIEKELETEFKPAVAFIGELDNPLNPEEFTQRIKHNLGREPLHIEAEKELIKTVGFCTGGAQSLIYAAATQGCDAYISGEISESTVHIAREMNIHYYAAGHHATETFGAKSLGKHLEKEHGIKCHFVDVDSPA